MERWLSVSALSDIVFWEETDGRLAYISEGIRSFIGISPEDLLQDPTPWTQRVHSRHRGRYLKAVNAAREHGSYTDIEYRAALPKAGVTWLRDHLLFDRETQTLCGVTLQLSAEHESEERLGFLNKAARLLASSLETSQLLRELAALIAGSLADTCIIEVAQGDDILTIVRCDSSRRLASRLEALGPMMLDGRALPSRIRKGRAVLHEGLTPKQLERLCGAGRVSALGRKLPHSAIIAPLSVRGRLMGTVTLLCSDPARDYAAKDVQLTLDVCAQAAIALDHARLFEDVTHSQQRLAAENEMKDEFLAIISHELRTPLTVIYGVSRLLPRLLTTLEGEGRELVTDLNAASERTLTLVDDLMLLAKLNLGEEPDLEPISIRPLMGEICQDFGKQYPERQVLNEVVEDRTVLGSPAFVRQIVLNLLANAHKYSPTSAPIEIHSSVEGNEVIFTVTDSGKGVPEDELESIFDRFYRASTSTGISGSGMGLSICKRLVEAQKGRIWARIAEKGGLSVSFCLPKV